jgi:hypothetical protein
LKAIVDEGVPRRLVTALKEIGCDIARFPNDWKGRSNGRLLSATKEAGFDCLVTCDKNIAFQQNIEHYAIALIVLPKPDFPELQPIIGSIHRSISEATSGTITLVNADGTILSLPPGAK